MIRKITIRGTLSKPTRSSFVTLRMAEPKGNWRVHLQERNITVGEEFESVAELNELDRPPNLFTAGQQFRIFDGTRLVGKGEVTKDEEQKLPDSAPRSTTGTPDQAVSSDESPTFS